MSIDEAKRAYHAAYDALCKARATGASDAVVADAEDRLVASHIALWEAAYLVSLEAGHTYMQACAEADRAAQEVSSIH